MRILQTALIIFTVAFICFGQEKSKTYEETRNLLLKFEDYNADGSGAKLFQTGDERINDLITALDDSDENVRLNTQQVIRYLGNPKGTKALYIWLDDWLKNSNKRKYPIAFGAIPLPINQWEFNFAERKSKQFGKILDAGLGFDNIYPLLLDSSNESKELLKKVLFEMEKGEYGDYWITRTKKIIEKNPRKVFYVKDSLEKSVLENAYFLHSNQPNRTTVKLLAYNGKKDKVWLFFGTFEAGWHIVIEKDGDGWKFFSITQTSVS